MSGLHVVARTKRYGRRAGLGLALLVVWSVVGPPAVATAQNSDRWVGTWATGPVSLPVPGDRARSGDEDAPPRIKHQTVRQVVRTSIGGTRVRVLFTNQYGTQPLEIGAASIALRDRAARVQEATVHRITFDSERSGTVERGASLLSDAVDLVAPPGADLVIDTYFPGDSWAATSPATTHRSGLSTTYFSKPGDHTGVTELPVDSSVQSWFFLSRVEVLSSSASGAIVTIGDSITDGTASTPDTNSRWPDFLARRLQTAYGDAAPAVLNVGIAGNRVLSHNGGMATIERRGAPFGPGDMMPPPNAFFGPSAISRFDRDVLLQPGVTHVVVLESINDVGFAFDNPWPAVDDLIAGHTALVQRAHARGLRIYGGTLTPFEGAITFSETGERKRQAFNEWIRTASPYDAVIDFDAAIRDPDNPRRIHPDYDPGDAIHCNDAGYKAMAAAVDLALFDVARPAVVAAGTR
jgi:lysophospholipase L1-like esterase